VYPGAQKFAPVQSKFGWRVNPCLQPQKPCAEAYFGNMKNNEDKNARIT